MTPASEAEAPDPATSGREAVRPAPAAPTPPSPPPSSPSPSSIDAGQARDIRDRIRTQIARKIVGQNEVVDLLLVSLCSRGNCLFIGVPGLAKTLLISTLAETTHLGFSRIQFTPDLMPSDITGTDIIDEDPATRRRIFRFVQGPVFTNILLADEINRTPPKTQAALLQAMQERQVSAGGRTYPLEEPFLVFATQNPIEQEGTYPLPEAQLDRFMFSVEVGYPSYEEEVEIVRRTTRAAEEEVDPVVGPEEILALQHVVREIPASDHAVGYAVRLVQATRPGHPTAPRVVRDFASWGAGPRASQFLILGSKARALLDGRHAASVEDIRALAPNVLGHRILLNYQAEAEKVGVRQVLGELLDSIAP